MNKNNFVKFPGGFGVVVEVYDKSANVILHNGIKITTGVWAKESLKIISRDEFFDLVKQKGQTLWHSYESNLNAFHDVTLIEKKRAKRIDVSQMPVEQPIVNF